MSTTAELALAAAGGAVTVAPIITAWRLRRHAAARRAHANRAMAVRLRARQMAEQEHVLEARPFERNGTR